MRTLESDTARTPAERTSQSVKAPAREGWASTKVRNSFMSDGLNEHRNTRCKTYKAHKATTITHSQPAQASRSRTARHAPILFTPFPARSPTMMKNQLAGLMKQAQQMQDNMKKMQDELALVEVEGQSGAGLVKVIMTCKNDVRRVTIDPSLLADDKDMLEDLVAAAFNDAVRKAEATTQEKMSGMTAGMPMPPGFKLPF